MTEQTVIGPYPGSGIPHVGTYRRVLPVTLARLYENALDWQHLPWLHASTFRSIHCLDQGAWGWRAAVGNANGSESVLELRLDRVLRRWITRNLDGPNRGAEIWTHAFETGVQRVEINVDFFVPDVVQGAREKVGKAYARAYARLYDEDVAMMVERQRRLDERVAGRSGGRLVIGTPAEVAARLETGDPVIAELEGRSYRVARAPVGLVAFPVACPHMLGPLTDVPVVDGRVRCPWHGFEFDIVTGEGPPGQPCRFGPRPAVFVHDGLVVLLGEET